MLRWSTTENYFQIPIKPSTAGRFFGKQKAATLTLRIGRFLANSNPAYYTKAWVEVGSQRFERVTYINNATATIKIINPIMIQA